MATVDKEDHQVALNPSRPGMHEVRRGAQNAATSPLGFGHGEDPASRNGSSATGSGQGTWGGHGDPSRENALEDHNNPKTHPTDIQVRADAKEASTEMPRH